MKTYEETIFHEGCIVLGESYGGGSSYPSMQRVNMIAWIFDASPAEVHHDICTASESEEAYLKVVKGA
jgi:hypothetical protein